MIGPDAYPSRVIADVINTIRNSTLQLRIDEIVNINLFRVTFGAPFTPIIGKAPTISFFFVSTETTGCLDLINDFACLLYIQTAHLYQCGWSLPGSSCSLASGNPFPSIICIPRCEKRHVQARSIPWLTCARSGTCRAASQSGHPSSRVPRET